MESVRPSGDGAHLTVGALRARIRQPCCNVTMPSRCLVIVRATLAKGLRPECGPRYPLLQLHQHDIRLTAIREWQRTIP
jgi:hypothetical protein